MKISDGKVCTNHGGGPSECCLGALIEVVYRSHPHGRPLAARGRLEVRARVYSPRHDEFPLGVNGACTAGDDQVCPDLSAARK